MYVLDSIRESDQWKVKLPLYHRGHLALLPGTTVHLAWVFRDDPGGDESSLLPEIFGTTVRHNAWPNVYRISIALYDAPGVLHRVLQSISRHGGNVLQLDSTSTERELHHNAEMMVDFASVVHESRRGLDHSREIEGLLLADCAAHVVSEPGNDFRLRVRSVSSFRRMDGIVANTRASGDLKTVSEHRILSDGSIELDDNFRHLLHDSGIDLPIRYLVTSDTKDRVFRVTFFPDTQPVVWCTIRHADKEGAIEAITAALSKEGITLLCALNRVQEHLGHNWFETVVTSAKWRLAPAQAPGKPHEMIAEILQDPALGPYRVTSFFDRREARRAMREPIEVIRGAVYVRRRDRDVDQWLAEKDSELEALQLSNRDRMTSDEERRHERALASGIDRVRVATGRQIHKIFLSIEFTKRNKSRIDMVEEECLRAGFVVDVVKNARDEEVIWREVVDRVQRATDMIAVWTPSTKAKSDRVSPWCLWELGVANGLHKDCYVMLQEGTDPIDFTLIHGAEYYYPFRTDQEFRTELRSIVRQIAARETARHMHPRWSGLHQGEEARY